jgi:adenine deaminase
MAGSARVRRNPKPHPELLFSNCELFDPCTCSWNHTSFTVSEGRIRHLGITRGSREQDLGGARVIPGLIDAHVHVESSLLCPAEFGRLVLSHGITTVIADPHEIANVLGIPGILYMMEEEKNTPLDIFFMLPSCVPASADDWGGAVLRAEDLAPLLGHEKVLGLGEVMDVGAVLAEDPEMRKKLHLTRLIDGHAPGLRGGDLDRYLEAGIESDHECTELEEGREKLKKGMYLMIRQGSTEKNLRDLIPLAAPCALPRLSFATDDRHADTLLREGSIDDCIRRALAEGTELEMALRMATLSPCDRFMLRDRGMITPGKIADFCVLARQDEFQIAKTFKRGREVTHLSYRKPAVIRHIFQTSPPEEGALRITGSGNARVIGLQEGQILTRMEVREVRGDSVPDTEQDILPLLVCSRYRPGRFGLGLVHGFGLQEGALASSVAHDAHNVVAVGADERSLREAVRAVISRDGAMVVARGDDMRALPLDCAGLMSSAPCGQVVEELDLLEDRIQRMGGIAQAFMYLSFLTLSVVPELRLTENGLYDVATRSRVPLFVAERQDSA